MEVLMNKHKVSILLGDGVGPIQAKYSSQIICKLAEKHGFQVVVSLLSFGKECYKKSGTPLPDETICGLNTSDASLLFAVDGSDIPGATPVGRLRKVLQLYAETRKIIPVPGQWAISQNINICFVREITEGFLCDRNLEIGMGEWQTDKDTACSIRVIRRYNSMRIAEYAFDYAYRNGYQKVTAAHKASIFKLTCGLFLECCREVKKKYPSIEYEEKAVDDIAGDLISKPESFGVIVTTNMFGDILSDEGASLVSGLCVGSNIGERTRLYMPVRHSALYQYINDDSFDSHVSMMCISELLNDLGEATAAKELNSKIFKICGKGSNYLEKLLDSI